MWFLATFRMISVLTILNKFIQISSYEQQYLAEYLVHIFLTTSRHINKFFKFIIDLNYKVNFFKVKFYL